MSDTPRLVDLYRAGCDLQRELNAANGEIERLRKSNLQLREGGEEQKQRIQSLIAERDTARLQSDQKVSLREEFRELLGTDDIEVGVAVVCEMKNRIKRLEAVVNDPHALWTNWLRGNVKLPVGIGDVRQYQDRIKQLEEAGDEAIHEAAHGREDDALEIWNKAKEDKL